MTAPDRGAAPRSSSSGRRHCTWCSAPWAKGHSCDKPADFSPTRTPTAQRGPGYQKARAYALTPAGWDAAGYDLVPPLAGSVGIGRYVKRADRGQLTARRGATG